MCFYDLLQQNKSQTQVTWCATKLSIDYNADEKITKTKSLASIKRPDDDINFFSRLTGLFFQRLL